MVEGERRSTGMFPDKPMAECRGCGSMSYLAATDGICLGCVMDEARAASIPDRTEDENG